MFENATPAELLPTSESSVSHAAIEPSIKGLTRVRLRYFAEPFLLFGLGLSGIMESYRLKLETHPESVLGKLTKNKDLDGQDVKDIVKLEELWRELDIIFMSGSVEWVEGESQELALFEWYEKRNNLIVEIGHLLIKTGIVDTYNLPIGAVPLPPE